MEAAGGVSFASLDDAVERAAPCQKLGGLFRAAKLTLKGPKDDGRFWREKGMETSREGEYSALSFRRAPPHRKVVTFALPHQVEQSCNPQQG